MGGLLDCAPRSHFLWLGVIFLGSRRAPLAGAGRASCGSDAGGADRPARRRSAFRRTRRVVRVRDCERKCCVTSASAAASASNDVKTGAERFCRGRDPSKMHEILKMCVPSKVARGASGRHRAPALCRRRSSCRPSCRLRPSCRVQGRRTMRTTSTLLSVELLLQKHAGRVFTLRGCRGARRCATNAGTTRGAGARPLPSPHPGRSSALHPDRRVRHKATRCPARYGCWPSGAAMQRTVQS